MSKSQSLALSRQAEAVRLHREGYTFEAIKDELGYANRGTVHRVVTNAYRERIAENIDEHRQVELGTLDLVIGEAWDIVQTASSDATRLRALGEIRAATTARSKILGLHDHTPKAEPEQKMLFDLSLGQLRKGNTCRISGDAECGFEPKDHSQECVKKTLGFVPYADGEASE